jgi:2-oxo-4-hydroxy-4-carboxy-5-ureidoimidazoline decarboxylase
MTLTELDLLPADALRERLLECCGSVRWVDRLLVCMPFESATSLFENAEAIWQDLDPQDWLEAFSKHPQIGARGRLSAWSSQEQAGMNDASIEAADAMRELNRRYLETFGWIFIVCATSRSAEEMRTVLEQRLTNAPSEELRIAAGEQAKIMHIRLRKLLET